MNPIARLRRVERARAEVSFTILIVEDDVEYASELAAALEHDGADTLTAHTCIDGVRLAHEHRPDAVLLDLGLPDGHGYEVARALRNECLAPEAAVVVLTASAIRDLAPAETIGVDLILNKPVDPDLLGGLLRHVHAQRKRKSSTR
ncbi:MAG: response regulator [Deltaproteobacteria bacterium]|nr:response regulator [Deltaproteobacteria bacterium]MDQ3295645.1 response regulator [Myxococcota bacterium]